MRDLLFEINYELTRTLKHIFYLLLVVSWFVIWYGIFYAFIGEWNMKLWSDGILEMYFTFSIITGFGYFIYRVLG